MTKSTTGTLVAMRLFSGSGGQRGGVRIYGCSPGCLAVSIALSLFLTLAINGCIYFFR